MTSFYFIVGQFTFIRKNISPPTSIHSIIYELKTLMVLKWNVYTKYMMCLTRTSLSHQSLLLLTPLNLTKLACIVCLKLSFQTNQCFEITNEEVNFGVLLTNIVCKKLFSGKLNRPFSTHYREKLEIC